MKSILIIDTPKDCDNCPCADGELGFCQADEKQRYCDWYKVPLWCPLKKMPKKKNTPLTEYNLIEKIYENGWNECLEEIEK